MATVKQCKMLAAKSIAAGIRYNWDEFKELDNGDVTAKAEELDKKIEERIQEPNPVIAQQKPEINGQRYGMCYKLVRDDYNKEWIKQHEDEFLEEVAVEYERATRGEERISSSSSTEPDNQDARAEAAHKRQLEDEGGE